MRQSATQREIGVRDTFRQTVGKVGSKQKKQTNKQKDGIRMYYYCSVLKMFSYVKSSGKQCSITIPVAFGFIPRLITVTSMIHGVGKCHWQEVVLYLYNKEAIGTSIASSEGTTQVDT